MPEIDFYFSGNDFAELGEMIFANGMVPVLDCRYPTRRYKTVKSLDEFLEASKICSSFFLLHHSYNHSPLDVEHVVRDNGTKFYFIMPRNGGPTIDLRIYGDETYQIRKASLSHYPSYWNTVEEINLPAPESLKQKYRRLTSLIKKSREKLTKPTIYNKSKRSAYLGAEAKRLRDRGVRLVGWDDGPLNPS